jgi:hypothetical protein
MTRAVFNEVKHPGESFSDLATDPEFAERVFIRRMVSLRSRLGSWQSAVRAYNAGVTGAINGRGYEYLNDVRQWAASRGLSFNQ